MEMPEKKSDKSSNWASFHGFFPMDFPWGKPHHCAAQGTHPEKQITTSKGSGVSLGKVPMG
jgi:hypothetical protein